MFGIRKSSFHPLCDLQDKHCFKPYYRVERDGTVCERILLDVHDISLREELICKHFLRNHVLVFLKEAVRVNILSRDNPWDFEVELSNKEQFNIEITSIAEDSSLFEKLKREERMVASTFVKEIPFHELKKINSLFPEVEISSLIISLEARKIARTSMVENPYFGKDRNLFFSDGSYGKEPFRNLIKKAIEKKEAKKNPNKENTVLVLDNRTVTYEYKDLQEASQHLTEFYESSSFKEIWFYTGYCSDYDGNNAEFSLGPLKLPELKWKVMIDAQKGISPDENGIVLLKI